jgi:hypothetical protein
MLKNESAQNATKPMPLRQSRLPDSGGIFTLSNELRMEKISHSVRKVKQAKKLLTVQSVQSIRMMTWHVHTLTWQVRTGDVVNPEGDTCQADLDIWAYSWTYPEVTRVTTGRVTCGTDDVSI